MESIQIFLKLDGLFKPKGIVPAKTFLFMLNLDSWQKLIYNRSVGNIGFSCSYIIIVVIDASCVIHFSCKRRSKCSVFPNNVPKKQSNRIKRYDKRNDLAISFDKSGDVMC